MPGPIADCARSTGAMFSACNSRTAGSSSRRRLRRTRHGSPSLRSSRGRQASTMDDASAFEPIARTVAQLGAHRPRRRDRVAGLQEPRQECLPASEVTPPSVASVALKRRRPLLGIGIACCAACGNTSGIPFKVLLGGAFEPLHDTGSRQAHPPSALAAWRTHRATPPRGCGAATHRRSRTSRHRAHCRSRADRWRRRTYRPRRFARAHRAGHGRVVAHGDATNAFVTQSTCRPVPGRGGEGVRLGKVPRHRDRLPSEGVADLDVQIPRAIVDPWSTVYRVRTRGT